MRINLPQCLVTPCPLFAVAVAVATLFASPLLRSAKGQTSASTAGTLYVDLRATASNGAGTATWGNLGTIGDFVRTGAASLVTNVEHTGVPGVLFNGNGDAYTSINNTVADLVGSSDRSIEVWAYNPTMETEESLVSWGLRSATHANVSLNLGYSTGWGAATHINDDLPWTTPPATGRWHHLTYVYSGSTDVRVYVDGVLSNSKTLGGVLATTGSRPINIGAQRTSTGTGLTLYYSGYINSVRVHGGALTAEQVAANYALGPVGATPASDLDSDGLPDNWEQANLGGLNYGAHDDPDGDGYTNLAEFTAGTNPSSAASKPSWKSPRVASLQDSVVTSAACLMPSTAPYGRAINGISFQKQILHTFNGYQYTAWYDTVGSTQTVWLARRTVKGANVGPWQTFNTGSTFVNGKGSWDSHNVIAFGICPADGTLHIAWDHHNRTLRYRRSIAGLCTTNTAAWGMAGMLNAEQNWLVSSGSTELDVTYPQFITTPDGGLMLDRRIGISGNGDQHFQLYNPTAGAWSAKVQFINRAGTYVGSDAFGTARTATERCAYLNGFDFGPDGKIHVTWTWRESASQYGNRDICYAYSPDMGKNWYNNAGAQIADTSLGQTITQASPGITIAPLDMRQLMINQQAQCVDNDGRVHVLMLHRRQDSGYEPNVFSKQFSTKFTAYYHYIRDPSTGKWSQRRIPVDAYPVGSRSKICYDAAGNLYAAFISYPAGTDATPGYTSGKLVIATASKASQYTDWEVVYSNPASFNGEPLIDQARLLSDNVLSVYIQEHSTTTAVVGTPLHVFEFTVIPQVNVAPTLAAIDDQSVNYGTTSVSIPLTVGGGETSGNGK
jgi:hypothetical protein